MAHALPVVRGLVLRFAHTLTQRFAAVILVAGMVLFPAVSLAVDRQVYFALDGGVQAGDFGTPVRNTLYGISTTLRTVAGVDMAASN